MLTKKGQHAEQFVGFGHKPKLMARFKERIEDYSNFWMGIQKMCEHYLVCVLFVFAYVRCIYLYVYDDDVHDILIYSLCV